MIGYLKGTVLHSDLKSVILDVGGVGYKIHTNTAHIQSPPERSGGNKSYKAIATTEFWTHLAVRENALDLYGFTTKEEINFFELLITVSGIGPKSAMAIMSVATLSNLRHAISSGDTGHLTKVSGVGKKNAEKIVLELKDKIGDYVFDGKIDSGNEDAIEALKSLGYSEKESRQALKKAVGQTTQEKIRSALKNLNK